MGCLGNMERLLSHLWRRSLLLFTEMSQWSVSNFPTTSTHPQTFTDLKISHHVLILCKLLFLICPYKTMARLWLIQLPLLAQVHRIPFMSHGELFCPATLRLMQLLPTLCVIGCVGLWYYFLRLVLQPRIFSKHNSKGMMQLAK